VKPDSQGIYADKGWDSGLINEPACHSGDAAHPPFDCSYTYQSSPNEDIIGIRHYGRLSQQGKPAGTHERRHGHAVVPGG
jgi:hypothetical protein